MTMFSQFNESHCHDVCSKMQCDQLDLVNYDHLSSLNPNMRFKTERPLIPNPILLASFSQQRIKYSYNTSLPSFPTIENLYVAVHV